jgi:antitoxin CptB
MTMLMIFTVGAVSVECRLSVTNGMNSDEMIQRDTERQRCYWRSRRGLLELDLLLPPFVESRFDALSRAHQLALQCLLECEDQDIWDWYQRRSVPVDPALGEIIEFVRAFNDGGRANSN